MESYSAYEVVLLCIDMSQFEKHWSRERESEGPGSEVGKIYQHIHILEELREACMVHHARGRNGMKFMGRSNHEANFAGPYSL